MNRIFLVGKLIHLLAKTSIIISLSLIIIACGETPDEEVGDITTESKSAAGILLSNDLITRASWSDRRSRLRVSGDALRDDELVQIFDETVAGQRTFIGSTGVDSDRNWEFDFFPNDTSKVPCVVYVKSDGAYERAAVSDAPSDCGLAYANQEQIQAQAPEGSIDTPVGDISVVIGSSVTFNGSAIDGNGDVNLKYTWDFGSYAIREQGQSTTVNFNRAGTVMVKLLVQDSSGLYDPTPDSVVVTVLDRVINSAPNGNIISPSSNQTINVGDAISFSGSATDPEGNAISYLWDFGASGIPRNMNRSTGPLSFNRAGVFDVTLTVSDDNNAADLSPAKVTVTVNDSANRAPNGNINTPSGSRSINVGQALSFDASGTDPDGDSIVYLWNFGASGIANSTKKTPGSLIFNKAGIFPVSLIVTDSKGLADPTPSSINVTVNSLGDSAPNGTIVSPVGSTVDVFKGGSLTFKASAIDPDGDTNLNYSWNFGSYRSGLVGQNVTVSFDTVATVTVRLNVRDSSGKLDPTADTITVRVLNEAINSEPNGTITRPTGNRTINVGESINFASTAADPEGGSLTYLWDFGASGISRSSSQNPGSKVFNKAGTFDVSLTVTDNKGLPDSTPDIARITVGAANSAPNGNINSPSGSRTIEVGSSIFFDGSGSDADGDSVVYLWNFGNSGIANSTKKTPGSLVFNKVGVYPVTLTVTDSKGLADPTPASINITVNSVADSAPNGTIQSPAGSTVDVFKGKSLTFTATATDPDGDTNLNYFWNFGEYRSGLVGQNVTVTFDTVATVTVKLNVRDSSGKLDSTPDTITVRVLNQSINAEPNGTITSPTSNRSINVGESINFSSTASDPEGDPLVYLWDFGTSGISRSTSKNPGNKVFNKAGIFDVSLTVTDDKGLSDSTPDTVRITVATSNTAPNGQIDTPTNRNINPGESLFFSGTGTDADGDAVVYLWDFGNSGVAKSTKEDPGTIIFNQAGSFQVSLTVTDENGLSDPTPATMTVNVAAVTTGNPNGFIVSPIVSSVTVPDGGTLTLTASGTDPDGDTQLTYIWDFGAYGPKKIGQTVSMTFDEPGAVMVKLLVRDSTNLYDLTPATLTVSVLTITQGNQPPESVIRVPSTDKSIAVGEAVFFGGLATDPEDNTPLKYFWNFDGAVPNSTMQNPGSIVFNNPGVYRVTLASTDNMGATDNTPAVRIITVDGASVSAPDSIINSPASDVVIDVGDSVRFSGSGTDLDNDTPYAYFWNFDGVAPNSTRASPGDVTFNNAGVYNISLRVTDSTGTKDSTPATVRVTVTNFNSQNEPPNSVIITPSMNVVIFEGDSLTLRGTGNDPEGDTLVYLWDLDGAAPNSTANNPGDIQFTQAGIYNIRFAATDSSGLTDPTPATVRVTVKAAPSSIAPNGVITSPATGMRINVGDVINFSGYGTDADGNTPLSYLWNFDGAAPHAIGASPGNVVFANPGTYRVRFSVTDVTGLTDPTPEERIIVVEPLNRPTGNSAPNGVIDSPMSDAVVFVGQTINFSASGTDPDGDTSLRYRWNFGGVVPNSTAQDPGLVTFNQVGTYRVVLTVTDSFGVSDASPAERLVTVIGNATQNQAPNAIIVTPSASQDVSVNGVVSFEGAGTDPDNNTPLTYLWDFNGAVPNVVGRNPGNVTFKKAGFYTVTLNVVDSQGAVDPTPARVTINVSEGGGNNTGTGGANWPILNPASAALTLNVGDTYTFEGTAIGQNGEVASFAYWNFNGYTLNALGTSVTKTFDRAGTVTVDYKVKDASGSWVQLTDSVIITVR